MIISIAFVILSLSTLVEIPVDAISTQTAAQNAETSYQDAVKALASKDYVSALTRFEEALSADPDNILYGSKYRQAIIHVKQYDRCTGFFEALVAKHPDAANAYLNYGFAFVDKIPDAGAISQLILANKALPLFSKSLELRPSWLGYYTRGNSYLYWPKVFNRTQLGLEDLEQAMKMQKAEAKRSYHVRAYISLGDGHWKMDELKQAKALWREGLARFPGNSQLSARLSSSPDQLKSIIESAYDPNVRIDTNLQEFSIDESTKRRTVPQGSPKTGQR